ncbi:AgPET8 [Verticillium alfalfae VaMs.102]|uniref:AgPET8 n=1 Tax=Verticillium alfalfae (strain VaMs.102 / ATCC MYA-4576 / FGSC 10136) TaxID=526221 RepID=C9S876_VERA1|nr:AgPET8 [Verticillium alfalfae VaMs.102]EEY15326.1 AgPET8 [Verticillium alfalfae VaMs.102]
MYEIYAAGAAAAFTVDCLIYPLDTLKTRYQSQDFVKTYASSPGSPKPQLYRGLYQGIGSVILATLPAAIGRITQVDIARGNAACHRLGGEQTFVLRLHGSCCAQLAVYGPPVSIFEYMRQQTWDSRHPGQAHDSHGLLETAAVNGVSAGSAGGFAAWITTPSDVVKTRMMLTAGDDNNPSWNKTNRGSIAVAQDVYRRHGVKGAVPRRTFACELDSSG